MTLSFRKTKPSRVFRNVADQIQAAILDGRLRPGDTLPPEMKLKEMFDASRGSIREALRVLEQKGLVEVKIGVGGGAVVRPVDTRTMSEGLDLLLRSRQVSLEQVTEFREQVEGIVAGLAARRATRADVAALAALIEEAGRNLQGDGGTWRAFADVDVRFHLALAGIAGNPIFTAVLTMVHQNIIEAFDPLALDDPAVLKENHQDLRALAEAVADGRADQARTLARRHVRRFSRYLAAGRGTDSGGGR